MINIILSAELSSLSKIENRVRTNKLRIMLKEHGIVTEVLGSYKGTREQSFMVRTGQGGIAVMLDLAQSMGQESILVVELNGKATLYFTSGSIQEIGTLKIVPKTVALDHDAWSFINGSYLIAE